MRILVVDENPERSAEVVESLAAAGHEIVGRLKISDDLRRAIARHHLDIVVIDLDSPYRDCLEDLTGFLFGRVGEEAEHLLRHGVAVRVIPGATAALGCAASAEMPLTHRGLSRALHLVTGQGRGGGLPRTSTATRDGGTIAVCMGR